MPEEGLKIGSAYVELEADASGLEEQARTKAEAATAGVKAPVGLTINQAGFREEIAAAARAAGAGEGVQVQLGVDGDHLREEVRAEVTAAGAGEDIKIKVNVDAADAAAKLTAVDGKVRVVDASGNVLTQDATGNWHNALGRFASDAAKAAASVDGLGTSFGPAKDSGDAFEREFRAAMGEAEKASQDADKALSKSFSDIEKASRSVRASMSDVAESATETGNKTREAGDKTADAGRKANGSGGGFMGLSGSMWALVGAAGAVGPALAALPAVLAGGGLAAVTLGGAFASVASTLKDHVAAVGAVGQSGAQLAATEFSNAVAIRGAEQAIVDAKKQGATAAVASAQQVTTAQQSLFDAERQAQSAAESSADAIISAQQRVASATYSLTQAQQSETNALRAQQEARLALTQAQADAANTIADAKNGAADSHLAVEGAMRAEAAAQKALDAANATGTVAQQSAADFELRQAKQALIDAKQRDLEATQKATAAQKEGVNGLPAVVNAQHAVAQAADGVASAQHGVTVALQGQADAQHALVLAQRDAMSQQITSAERIAKAQSDVADAVKGAADQQVASAQAVTRAEQALRDMRTQQALAAAAAADSAGAASNKFAADMAKDSQPVRDMVTQLLSMKGGFDQLKLTAETATLPGFTQMLRDTGPLLPIVDAGVRGMGHALSDTALAFGHLFTDSAFQRSAQQFTTVVVSGFGQVASALPPLLDAIVTDGAKAGPIFDAVAGGVHDLIATGLPDFLSGLSTDASGAGQSLSAIFRVLGDLLGPVGTLTGAFAGALGPALADLEPDIKMLATDIENDLLPIMPQLSTDLLDLAKVADELFKIIEPLVPIFAEDLASGLRIIDPLLRDTAGFLHDNQQWLTPVAEGVLELVAAVKAWKVGAGLADDATKLWKKSMELFGSEGKLATGATKAWKVATSDLAGTLGTVVPIVGGIVGGSLALGKWLGSVGDHARDADAEVAHFTNDIIDLSRNAPNAGGQLDFLARSAVGLNKSLGGGGALLVDVDTSLANLVSSGHADQAAAAMDSMTKSVQAGGGSVDDLRKLLPHYGDALGDAAVKTKQAGEEAMAADRPFQGLALRLTDTGQAGKNSAAELGHVDSALSNLDRQLSKQQALDNYNKSLNNMKDGAAGASRSIDGNSQSAMDNRKQLEDAVTAARHYYDAQIAAGVSVDEANGKFQDQVDKLRTQAEKTYGSKKAVDDFLTSIDLIKPDYTTTLKVNATEGRQELAGFQKILDGLKLSYITLAIDKIVGADGRSISVAGSTIKARAEGGPVGAGDLTLVGERGPELVRFTRPGYVYPNDRLRQATAAAGTGAATATRPVTNNFNYYGTQHPTAEQKAVIMRDFAMAVAA